MKRLALVAKCVLMAAGCVVGAVALGGCGKGDGAPAAGASLPAEVFLASAPAEPSDIKAAKTSAKRGEPIVLRGRVGGSVNPFTPGRAVFTIVDLSVPSCADNPADACKTPWDYCCEDRSLMTASLATVQIVGADGKPLRVEANGARGLAPLSEVFVVGEVAETDNQSTLVVNATGLYVIPALGG